MTTNNQTPSIEDLPLPKRPQIAPTGFQWFFCLLILLCGMGIGFSAAQFWQPSIFRPPHHPPHPKEMVQRITKRFNLSEDQSQQILTVLTERHESMSLLRNKMHKRRQEEIEKFIVEMKSILNATQFEAWKHDFKKHHAKRRRHGTIGPRHP